MKKYLCTLLAAALLVLALSGCAQPAGTSSGDGQSAPPAGGDRVLRIAGESWQITKIFLEDAAAAFEADHPGVKVEVQTYADPGVVSNYAIDWSSGSTPVDLVMIDGAQFVQQFVAKDLIYDFENELDFFSAYPADNFVSSTLEMSRIDGKLYAIPVIAEVEAININSQMFRDAGLVDADGGILTPKTWQEFHDFAQKLTVRDSSGAVTQQGAVINWCKDTHGTVLGVLQALNGTIYAEDGVNIDFDNDAFREIFQVWREGVQDGSFSTETFADTEAGRNGYKAGNVAMLLESSSRWIEGGNEFGMDNVTVCPLPGDGGSCIFMSCAFIPKCTEAEDLAQMFIREQLLGEHVQTSTLNVYGKLPVITEYYDMAEAPDWGSIKSSMELACTYPSYQDSSRFQDELRIIIQEELVSDSSIDEVVQRLNDMIASLRK